MANHQNYWFSTSPTKTVISSGLVRNADVLIIGGGIAGITLLYQLLNAGVTNTYLVEQSSVGFHASGRSSGQLMFRGAKLFSEMPEEDAIEYIKCISENNRRFLHGLRNVEFDTDLRDTGGLRLASSEEELQKLKNESAFILKHAGIECPILSREEILGILPQSNFLGGMFVPTEATFNPYKVVNGLRELIEQKGSRVLTDVQVTQVVSNNDGSFSVSIRHRGVIKAKKIVYCINSYSSDLLPELTPTMIGFRGQMIATDNLPDTIAQILPAMSMSCNDCNEYFRVHNNRLLVGGMRHSVRGQQVGIINDGEVSPAVYDKLRSFVNESLPFLNEVKFMYTWSGIMCSTPDGLPLIGTLRDNEYILGGFNGYGFGHVLYGSMIIKDIIIKGVSNQIGVRLFDPKRFNG